MSPAYGSVFDKLIAMDKLRFLAVAELLAEPKWMRDLHVLAAAGVFDLPPQFLVVPPYAALRRRGKD